MKYKVVRIFDSNNLEARVNKEISEGWEPIGGVAFLGGDWYAQAMVLRAAPESAK